jgi:hypothetical protein
LGRVNVGLFMSVGGDLPPLPGRAIIWGWKPIAARLCRLLWAIGLGCYRSEIGCDIVGFKLTGGRGIVEWGYRRWAGLPEEGFAMRETHLQF